MIFKYILLISLGVFFLYVLLLPRQTTLRKVFILTFVFGMLIFSFRPDWSMLIANYFGVGRGADFLFYVSHLVLFFIAFVYYLKFKDLEIRFAKLVRNVAIDQAKRQGKKQNEHGAQKNTNHTEM